MNHDLLFLCNLAWSIFKRQNTGNVMYYMIHATDHPAAPHLMHRAYHESIKPKAPPKEVQMTLACLIEEYGEGGLEDLNGEGEG